jgi:hypothetical protein
MLRKFVESSSLLLKLTSFLVALCVSRSACGLKLSVLLLLQVDP